MLKSIGITFLLIICINFTSYTQEIEVEGRFLQENIKIGEPVKYYLKAKYPASVEVLFPGEDYTFTPFEFVGKEYYPSAYDSLFVIDSAVYTLTSFEIDPVQVLSLPVFLINSSDSTVIEPQADSLIFVEVAPEATDTTSLVTDFDYTQVPLQFNYPYLLIGVGVVIFALILVVIIFGKSFIKHLRIRKIKKNYLKFSERYDELVRLVQKNNQKEQLEASIVFWKKYLEKLDKKPYSKLTTKELIAVSGDERLRSDLVEIDRNLYSRNQSDDVINRLKSIKSIAEEYLEKKIASIKNG